MGKIVISTNMSLDGVVQDPDGEEGFRLGGWFNRFGGQDLAAWAELETAEALRSEALLLGRHSDAWFARRWLGREGAWGDRLNSLPKYVMSTTLKDPEWTNVTVLKGDVVDEVTRLKQAVDGEILIYASYQLGARADRARPDRRAAAGRLPGPARRTVTASSGRPPTRSRCVWWSTTTLGEGLAFLTYEFVREA